MIAVRHTRIQTAVEDVFTFAVRTGDFLPTKRAGVFLPSASMESMKPKSELNDTIVIPQEARGRLLSSFSTSVRLAHVFQFKKFRLLGELHGLTYYEISKYRNCGRKTVEELRQLVRNVQLGSAASDASVDESQYESPSRSDCLFIPPYAREFSPLDLPISVRLANALESTGIACLGDLQGRDLAEFKGLANCGKRTLAELATLIDRVVAGEFKPSSGSFSIANVADLLRLIDDGVAQLPTHWREMLLLRLGADAGGTWTLEEVGKKIQTHTGTNSANHEEIARSLEEDGWPKDKWLFARCGDGVLRNGLSADSGAAYEMAGGTPSKSSIRSCHLCSASWRTRPGNSCMAARAGVIFGHGSRR